MGLFYKVPDDLQDAWSAAQGAMQLVAGSGTSPPGMVAELLPEYEAVLSSTRDRLVGEGRQKDLKAFKKYASGVGKFMDNGPYNRLYWPLLCRCLDP